MYNIAPSHPILGLVADPRMRIDIMEWGFVPMWAKESADLKAVINARGETITEKPYFRGAFRSNRCAILADGFYEWRRLGKEKQPFRITLKDGGLFAMAGLRSERILSDGSDRITCAIITTGPNELMEGIHNRMPMMLDPEQVKLWLDPKATQRELAPLIAPYPSDRMRAYEVGTIVNSPSNNTPECIKPLGDGADDDSGEMRLF